MKAWAWIGVMAVFALAAKVGAQVGNPVQWASQDPLGNMVRHQLNDWQVADWLNLTDRQRKLIDSLRKVGGHDIRRYEGILDQVEASLTPPQRLWLTKFVVSMQGLAGVFNPGAQKWAGITTTQVARLREALAPFPMFSKPLNPSPRRTPGNRAQQQQEWTEEIKNLQDNYEIDKQKFARIKAGLPKPQFNALYSAWSIPRMPANIQMRMRDIIKRIDVQDEIGMSLHQVRVMQDEAHGLNSPGQIYYAPAGQAQRHAIAKLTALQRKRLQELALQSEPSLMLSPEIAAELGLTYEQVRDIQFTGSMTQLKFQLDAAKSYPDLSTMAHPPKGATQAQLRAFLDKEQAQTEKSMAESRRLEKFYEKARAAALVKLLTPAQSAKWRAMLGKPYPAIHNKQYGY